MCREWLNVHRRIVGWLLFKRCTKLKWECCFPQWLAIIKSLRSMGNFFCRNWGVQKSLWFIVGELNCMVKLCKAFLILEEFWWIYIFMKVVKCFHFLINPTMVLEELPLLSTDCDNKSFCSYCFTLQANHLCYIKIWGFIRRSQYSAIFFLMSSVMPVSLRAEPLNCQLFLFHWFRCIQLSLTWTCTDITITADRTVSRNLGKMSWLSINRDFRQEYINKPGKIF